MEQQALDLRPPLPLAPKRKDRSTSADALVDLKASGKLGEQQLRVLAALAFGVREGWDGVTSLELSDGAEIDRYVAARRLPELEEQRLVRRLPERHCAISGRRSATWEPTEAGRQAVREGLLR